MTADLPPQGVWLDHICADRHEVSGKWVLHYLTDAEARLCYDALHRPVSVRRIAEPEGMQKEMQKEARLKGAR